MAGERRYLGIAEETAFGVEAGVQQYLDFLSAELEAPSNPTIVMEGASRSMSIVAPGGYVPQGPLEFGVDLHRIGYFLKWGLGQYFTSGTVVGGGGNTTIDVDAAEGDTEITVDDATGIAENDYVMIEPNTEVVKVTGVAGNVLTLATGLRYDHAAGDTVKEVAAPYTHTFYPTPKRTLPSFTSRVGKDLLEHKFLGSTIDRLLFTVERGFLTCQAHVFAAKDKRGAIVTTAKSLPAASSYLSFRQSNTLLNENLDGSGEQEDVTAYVEQFRLEIANNIDGNAGVRHGSRFPREFEPNGVDVSGSVRMAFKNADELERFWADATEPQEDAITEFILENKYVVGTQELSFIAARAHWSKPGLSVRGRDRIVQEIEYLSVENSNFFDAPVNIRLKNTTPVY